MLKMLFAGTTAVVVLVTGYSLGYAQGPSAEPAQRVTAADLNALTDARVNVVKAALQISETAVLSKSCATVIPSSF